MKRLLRIAIVTAGVSAAETGLSAQNNSQFRDWKPSALAGAAQAKPRVACAALVSLTGYDFSVSSAKVDAATHPHRWALVCLIAFVLCGLLVANLRRSPTGRAR